MSSFAVGSLVRCRDREWVVLPSEQPDVLLLRPLGGTEAESCGIYLPLEGRSVQSAEFAPPDSGQAGDFVSGRLLRDAARLHLRSGAGPFRSLGHLGARPRPYQLVPLIMALRLETVRLLIADDVGVGKTVEAALIVRELLDRGEIRRFAVVCPPHLCDQWRRELSEKFALDAVVVRSSTAAQLERNRRDEDQSIFEYYPFTIVSVDYIKSEQRRDTFLRTCPELVIVDEAHTAARPGGKGNAQQQRYELIRQLAQKPDRHMLLLTATPHSGIQQSFQSLLELLRPDFAALNLERLAEAERIDLARHFVQRRRGDVQRWLDEETPFPTREEKEAVYKLPRAHAYRKLYDEVFAFAREKVTSGEAGESLARQRVRYWAALALLRCVMSSPAAAEASLMVRAEHAEPLEAVSDEATEGALEVMRSYVDDPTEPGPTPDVEPGQLVEEASQPDERSRLRAFADQAKALRGANDPKLKVAGDLVGEMLREGFNPIMYCRYIATAKYVAEELAARFKGQADLRVLAVTGEQSEEEREMRVAELGRSPRRLLVATDCLSEGINLQHSFDAVLHYDLPWNPNRLEQREGRVDRYGQPSPKVRTTLLYGEGNAMDEVVMKVLLRKARSIHRTLGISVPLPVEGETVLGSLIAAVFQGSNEQLSLFDRPDEPVDELPAVQQATMQWEHAVDRERQSRTRFAQHSIKPTDVAQELKESDAVLGDARTVERFVLAALERLGLPVSQVKRQGAAVWRVPLPVAGHPLHERFQALVRDQKQGELLISFENPAPSLAQSVGRNHPLTAALAEYLLETALEGEVAVPPAARAGVARTRAVTKKTTLLLLRVRMLIQPAGRATPLLAEELVVTGYRGKAGNLEWLPEDEVLALLTEAQPDSNVTPEERALQLETELAKVPALTADLDAQATARARRLEESHHRVRTATRAGRAKVTPHLPPDVLGVYVLQPVLA